MAHAPKYHHVYAALKAGIISGEYPAGSFLPPEAELAAKYRISRTTLRHAITLLDRDNLISVQQGRGNFVRSQDNFAKNGFVLFHNVTNVSSSLHPEESASDKEQQVCVQGGIIGVIPAPSEVAKALKVPEGTRVYRLERLSSHRGLPFSYQTNYFLCDALPGFERFSGQISSLHDLYHFLDKEYNLSFISGTENVSAVPASYFSAKLLSVEADAPLLSFERTSVFTGNVMEYTTLLVRSDLMKINIQMSGPPNYFR